MVTISILSIKQKKLSIEVSNDLPWFWMVTGKYIRFDQDEMRNY